MSRHLERQEREVIVRQLLTPKILSILKNKNTERPFTSKYHNTLSKGSYLCRGCGAVLFRWDNQFDSGCGWPSFDDEIKNAIAGKQDADDSRTEILCATCHGHLGHVFTGEQLTQKNKRHCVNGLVIEFVKDEAVKKTNEAIVSGGCFWGVQYLFEQLPGVLFTEVGYTGGDLSYPTYDQVCAHQSGHIEAIRIVFDSEKLSYDTVIKYFMEIHDPTQTDGQGSDLGSQYLSCIFYFDAHQKVIAENIIHALKQRGFSIATTLKPATVFWPAEEYHQQYYEKTKNTPYCHRRVKRF